MKDHNRIKKPSGIMRMILMLMLSFTLITGMSISPSAWMTVNGAESVVTEANSEELQTDDAKLADAQTASDEDSVNAAGISETLGTADNKAEESARVSDADKDTSSVDGSADAEKDSDKATDAEKNETSEESEPAAGLLKAPAQQNVLLAAGDEGTQEAVEENSSNADLCNFDVSGTEGTDWTFDPDTGVLTILGDVTVKNKTDITTTGQRIIVAANCTVTLDGIDIKAPDKSGPAILIQAENVVNLVLNENSVNNVVGAHGDDINATAGGYAGIEVEFIYEDGDSPANKKASLTISGSGTLNATGGPNAAGIGGSNSLNGSRGYGLYGNITINSGTVNAESPGGGAGIGSSNNPGGGTSTGSYKKTGHNTWGTITINGGTVNAKSTGSGAGIGGGNHVDSGKIEINGGTVTADGAAGIGCGIGSSKNSGTGGDKGPGYYAADIKINGGNITASSNDVGAAIGGGMYCDAVIEITGGTINATGGDREGLCHHGGAGIGGGYLGHSDITITGGDITAVGGDGAAGIGSGGSPNSKKERGINGRGSTDITTVDYTDIKISGGTINAAGGEKGGAGIGLGVGADKATISITGGEILAQGAKSERFDEDVTKMAGGAGIGSAYSGLTSGEDPKYFVEADIEVSITGGTVTAIGGWGASGIGSGADNTTAKTITIDVDNTDLQAYSDGTKFAIDTRHVKDDGTTESITEGRTLTGDILQGTFVHQYDQPSSEGVPIHQGTEGLKSIKIINDQTGEQKELTLMPDGYRSFATDVNGTGAYTVYSDDKAISSGSGRYFNKCVDDTRIEEEIRTDSDILERNVQYTVSENGLCDNFYLFPVKTVAIEKAVQGDTGSDMNMEVFFCLKDGDDFAKRIDPSTGVEEIWVEKITITEGVPQARAYFVNVDDKKYDVWEIKGFKPDGTIDTLSPIGERFGSYTLRKITTQHGDAVPLSVKDRPISDPHRTIDYTVEESGSDLKITATMTDEGRTEGNSTTLSLFADDVLTDYESKKLNKESGWSVSWTVPAANEDGTAIKYSIADTSNNATIDDNIWNDEVKVINTYESDKSIKLSLKKDLTDYFDASGTSNATIVFKVTAVGATDSNVIYENYYSFVFTSAADQDAQEIEIANAGGVTKVIIEEVYSPGYKAGQTAEGQTDTLRKEITEFGGEGSEPVEVTFVNTYDDRIVQGSGVINRYENKEYQAQTEPAA